jgi:hypothetical protein
LKPVFCAKTELNHMSGQERRTDDFRKDVTAFTKDTSQPGTEKPELTEKERNDEFLPQPLVKIVNYRVTIRRRYGRRNVCQTTMRIGCSFAEMPANSLPRNSRK